MKHFVKLGIGFCLGMFAGQSVIAQVFEPGMMVTSCQSSYDWTTAMNDPSSMVVGVEDLRNPAGTGGAQGQHWNYNNSNKAPIVADPAWIAQNLGEIFGLAIGKGTNPIVYAASSSAYQHNHVGPDGRHAIYKLRVGGGLTNGSYELFHAFLGGNPATSLGQIAFSQTHDVLYVSNFDDGVITALRDNGNGISAAFVGAFDHGLARVSAGLSALADDPIPPLTQVGRRVWGVQVNPVENRLYYAVRNATNHQIWSVPILGNGALDSPNTQLETDISPTVPYAALGISDIAFKKSGDYMVVSERGIRGQLPHSASVFHYQKIAGVWTAVGATLVGSSSNNGSINGKNSAGGVDFSHNYVPAENGIDPQSPEGRLLTTSNYNRMPSFFAYGVESTAMADALSVTHNTNLRYVVDLNGVSTGNDKTQIGDVEALRVYPREPLKCLGEARLKDPQCTYDPDTGAQLGHSAQLDFTNNSPFGTVADTVSIIAPAGVQASLDPVFTPLAAGQSYSGVLNFTGAVPDQQICFGLKLSKQGDDGWCCPEEKICITPPQCQKDCMNLIVEKLECQDDECIVVFENTGPVPIGSVQVTSNTTGQILNTVPAQLQQVINPGDVFDFVVVRGPTDGPVTIKFNGTPVDDGPWVEGCCEQIVVLPDAKEPEGNPRLSNGVGRDLHVLTLAFDRNGDGRADSDIVPPSGLAVPLEVEGLETPFVARTGIDGIVRVPSYISDGTQPFTFRVTKQGRATLNIKDGSRHVQSLDLFTDDERLNPTVLLMR